MTTSLLFLSPCIPSWYQVSPLNLILHTFLYCKTFVTSFHVECQSEFWGSFVDYEFSNDVAKGFNWWVLFLIYTSSVIQKSYHFGVNLLCQSLHLVMMSWSSPLYHVNMYKCIQWWPKLLAKNVKNTFFLKLKF